MNDKAFGITILSVSIIITTVIRLNKSEEFSIVSRRKAQDDSKRVVCISAPGKVLIAGGYLVLESPNIGVTIAATSRFFTKIRLKKFQQSIRSEDNKTIRIVVKSPQFYTQYVYDYNYDSNSLETVSDEKNSFVEKCLAITLAFIKQYLTLNTLRRYIEQINKNNSLYIVLLADNDFYSQTKELQKRNLPFLSSSLEILPKFIPCPKDEDGNILVAKTGLGSSAALTTSLVGGVLQWFNVINISNVATAEDRRLVHNLAQLVHGNAQGKIGSGFDVAAAVYGTQVYKRFNADSFSDCLQDPVDATKIFKAVMTPNAESESNVGWCQKIIPFSLPPGMDIVLGDVCGGSSSPSMARKVLAWRKANGEEAQQLWNKLSSLNSAIYNCLAEMSRHHYADANLYNWCLKWASEHPSEEWLQLEHYVTVMLLIRLRGLLLDARRALKAMGNAAGVGIEPDEQSEIADATAVLPGVVGAGVPGAGGADALFAITLSESARQNVEKMWCSWNEGNSSTQRVICPLILRAGSGSFAGIMAHQNMVLSQEE